MTSHAPAFDCSAFVGSPAINFAAIPVEDLRDGCPALEPSRLARAAPGR